MKIIKKISLLTVVMIISNNIDASTTPRRKRSVRKPTQQTQAAQPAQAVQQTLPPLPQKSFKQLLAEINTFKKNQVFGANNLFTDFFINWVKTNISNATFARALFDKAIARHLMLSGNNQKDKEVLANLQDQIMHIIEGDDETDTPSAPAAPSESAPAIPTAPDVTTPAAPSEPAPFDPAIYNPTLAVGDYDFNYQKFMKAFNAPLLKPDGTVNHDWIEGARIALRADGYNTSDKLTNVMKNYITNAVKSSPLPSIRNNLAFTLKRFEEDLAILQQKGITSPQKRLEEERLIKGINQLFSMPMNIIINTKTYKFHDSFLEDLKKRFPTEGFSPYVIDAIYYNLNRILDRSQLNENQKLILIKNMKNFLSELIDYEKISKEKGVEIIGGELPKVKVPGVPLIQPAEGGAEVTAIEQLQGFFSEKTSEIKSPQGQDISAKITEFVENNEAAIIKALGIISNQSLKELTNLFNTFIGTMMVSFKGTNELENHLVINLEKKILELPLLQNTTGEQENFLNNALDSARPSKQKQILPILK